MKHNIHNRIISALLVLSLALSLVSWGAGTANATAYVGVLSQNDSRWGGYYVNYSTIGASGCGILSLVNAVGYLSGKQMDVIEVALWAHRIGSYNPSGMEGGVYRTSLYHRVEAVYGKEFNITLDCASTGEGYWEGASSQRLKEHLLNGGVAVGHVPSHFIAIVGYDASTNKFHIYDSAAASHRGTNYNNGDVWLTEAALTRDWMYLDWFCLVSSTKKLETWIEKACFDVMVYRDRNKDLAGYTDEELKEHWLNHGIKEGRPSSTILDLQFYLNNNPDLQAAFGTNYEKLYNHFITSGYQEYRKSSALFDGRYYTNKYPDVVNNYDGPYLKHYVENGIYEGRRASLTFDPNYYWLIVPDVAATWPGDYAMCARHYAGHGINAQIEAYDREAPKISDAKITDIDATGYTITCKVTDNWGISKVVFPAWTHYNGQDDLPENFMNTQKGSKDGNIFTFRVKASDHNNEQGVYATHIYAVDKGGNETMLVLPDTTVKDPEPEPEPEPEQLLLSDASDYTRSEEILSNVTLGTTVADLLAQFENQGLKVLDKNGESLASTDTVCTGATVNLYSNGTLADSVTLAVRGDVDGNGVVDTTDYMRTRASILSAIALTPVEKAAADVDLSGTVNTTDYMRIKAHFLGEYDLYN